MQAFFPSAFENRVSRLRLRTIVRLRWIAVAGQALTVAGVYWGLGIDLPIGACLLIISLSAWVNIFLRIRFVSRERVRSGHAFFMLAYDLFQLSALLYLTGGLQNPFAFLIVAPVTVSASSQPSSHTIALGVLSALCVTALAFFHQPLPWFEGQSLTLPRWYVAGIWTAVISGAVFMALYVWRIAKETRQMSEALAATEMILMREQRLSALDGLAAAAAHGLGTPLSTITVVAKELSRELPKDSPLREDVELLRSQATRCREILATLSRGAGEPDAVLDRMPLTHLIEEAAEPLRALGTTIAVTSGVLSGRGGDTPEPVGARNPGVLYGIGNLIENAVDFAASRVDVDARWSADAVELHITDDGPGFPPAILERLGEPYVTTRRSGASVASGEDEGSGLGLGFFIAKTLLERSGARVEFSNAKAPAAGAVVAVSWPRQVFEDGRDLLY
ncbi:MAG: ActS/PrrB/RegB family redox-sensitive histidine kinase, partial [Pseudomonadota bacterium]|nr:ActS/PrrB/RegB family redox-sensitive histidine kinase [Pseudomonadota bacterium]